MDCFYVSPEENRREQIVVKQAIPVHNRSEFGLNCYDQADLLRALLCYLGDGSENLVDDLVESTIRRYPRISLSASHNLRQLMKLPELDSSDQNGSSIDVHFYSRALYTALRQLINALKQQRKTKQYNLDVVSDLCDVYLEAFFALSKRVVFSENNYNLFNRKFRRSKLLNTLLSFAAIKTTEKPYCSENEFCYYYYSLLDPFALDTLQRTLRCADYLMASTNGPLTPLRQALFLSSAQSAFRRFICLDDHLYRVDLNRHDSRLLAHPYEKLSSTEEMKPIRLFEKAAAYIRSNIPRGNDSYELSVCIIGHTETSHSSEGTTDNSGEERPLLDLAMALLNWYDRLSPVLDGQKKPLLELHIHNYINQFDAPPSNWGQARRPFLCEKNGHFVTCNITEIDYEEQFEFNTHRLRKLIRDHQIIFLLDCPWLSMENFSVREESSLDVFCRNLRNRNRTDPVPEANFPKDFQAFYKQSAMRELDAQYDRIMSSPTNKAGAVVRVIKNALVRNIQSIITEYWDHPQKKELFIFSSEQDGMRYSYLNTYPFTRSERYDGKSFSVVQFMNRYSPMLPCGNSGGVKFQISLWSILKYICVSYAYNEFTAIVDDCLKGRSRLDPGIYLELYRGILADFLVRPGTSYQIEIRLVYTDAAEKCIEELGFPPEEASIAKNDLLSNVMALIEPLYRKSVFGKNHQYGDDAIKTAFIMNLYSSARDISAMLFLHRYQIAVNTEDFSGFRLRFPARFPKKPLIYHDEEFKDKDFFLDKKLYQSLMFALENTSEFTLGLRAMLYEARELFMVRSDIDLKNQLLKNILTACENMGEEDTSLYKNAQHALWENM